jgi:hypothetical protein
MQQLWRIAAVLLCALVVTYPRRASAQSAAPIELKWRALEGCPSADTVLTRVRKIAGATRTTPNTLRADALVTQPSDGFFRLRLEIHYGNLAAVRNIEGKSCKDLAGAAAVALALLLSSEEPLSERDLAGTAATTTGSASSGATTGSGAAGGDQQTDTQTTDPSQPPTPPVPPPAQPPRDDSSSSVEPRAPRRWHVLLQAPLGTLSVGPMKQVSLGVSVGAGFSFDRWHFLAEGKLWASQHETVSSVGREYDVELSRLTVGARGCRFIIGGQLELAPCAVVSVHHLSVRSNASAFEPSGTPKATWAALGIGAQARLSIAPWFAVVAAVDVEGQLARPEFTASPPPESQLPTSEVDSIVRVAPVAATFSFGTEWIF